MSWPIVSLKDETILITKGTTPTTLGQTFENAGIPFLRAQNLVDGTVSIAADPIYISRDTHNALNRSKISPGDILISIAGTIGRAAVVPDDAEEMNCNQAVAIVRPSKQIHQRFLLHWLSGSNALAQVTKSTVTGVIANLSLGQIGKLQIPLPSLEEQRRIAAILDKAVAIRRKREQALALGDDSLRSVFLEMFGDPLDNPKGFPKERIDDHLHKSRAGTQSGPFGSALKKHEYTDSGVPVWGVENVYPNRFNGKARLFISNEKYEDLRRYSVVDGDVLISRAGTVGRMCVAETGCPYSIISTNLVRVSLDQSRLLPGYFVCLFTFFADRLDALKANNKDDAFTFLNPKTLRKIKIPIPDIGTQQGFVRASRGLKGVLARMQEQQQGLSDLFSSLSQRAFRGEL